MGYESKIYFVKDFGVGAERSKLGTNYSDIIATLDMSKMGYSPAVLNFLQCFNIETPFSIRVLDYDESSGYECMAETITDAYGRRLCYGNKKELLKKANAIIKEQEHLLLQDKTGTYSVYALFYILKDMIKAFVNIDDAYIVHYGY